MKTIQRISTKNTPLSRGASIAFGYQADSVVRFVLIGAVPIATPGRP
jgi:hypothetical protein